MFLDLHNNARIPLGAQESLTYNQSAAGQQCCILRVQVVKHWHTVVVVVAPRACDALFILRPTTDQAVSSDSPTIKLAAVSSAADSSVGDSIKSQVQISWLNNLLPTPARLFAAARVGEPCRSLGVFLVNSPLPRCAHFARPKCPIPHSSLRLRIRSTLYIYIICVCSRLWFL